MTKFILHGGFRHGEAQENDAFFAEILKDTPQELNILLVYFAKEPDRIPKNKAEDIEQFNKNNTNKLLHFTVATEADFAEQVAKAGVIYLHGGKTDRILKVLAQFTNLKELFSGKVIAGDSAGTNVLATAFNSISTGPGEGFGVLPIKIICHYTSDKEHALDGMYPELETICLKELEYIVIEE